MNQRKLILSVVWSAIGFFIFFTFLFFNTEMAGLSKRFPVIGQVKPFTLTDSSGKSFGYADLKGKVWIADFIFTTCSGICPIMSKHMAELHRTFEAVNNVQLVSFSVNPEVDTPEILRNYAAKLKANTN